MIPNGKEVRKQIKVNFEENTVDFFLPQDYSLDISNSVFSLAFPGYPPEFTTDDSKKLKIGYQFELNKSTNLSLRFGSTNFTNFSKSLINSIFLENKSLKKLKHISEGSQLETKLNLKIFTNPYALFLFGGYMEVSFKKTKSKNKLSSLVGYHYSESYSKKNYKFSSHNFFDKALNLLNKCKVKTNKIFLLLMFFEILKSFKLNSNLEIFLKFVIKYYFINMSCKTFKIKEFSSNSLNSPFDLFKKNTLIEKEVSIINLLLNGIIRSGNMCAL